MTQSDTYLGNSQVKRDGVVHNFTQEEVQEYVKCSRDPVYFALNYMKVIHPDHGLVPFKMYDYQQNMVNHFNENRFSIVLSCRQSGKTTTAAAYLLWKALFFAEETIVILANKGSTAKEILGRIALGLENIPFFLQPGCKELNKMSITFSNNTKLIAAATSSNSVRGMSASLLFLDEFAFVNRASEFYTSTYPIISSGQKTKVVITSTPNGIGNMFHSLWEGAVQGTSEFKPFTVNWWDVPGRDEEWKKNTIANTSEEQFRQEFSIEFVGSGNTLIGSNTLLKLKCKEPISTLQEDNIKVYEEPIKSDGKEGSKDHLYIMTVDVSQGRGQDCSSFSVIDISQKPFKQVATFNNNKMSPLIFPDIIVKMAKHFNDALVLIENNGPGQLVCNSIWYDYEYENMFIESSVKTGGLGVTTTKKVKRIGCSNLKDLLENNKLIVNDKETIKQLCYFEESGSSYKAKGIEFDDMVMTLVLFSWFISSQAFGDYDEIQLREMIFDNELKKIDDEFVDFGFLSSSVSASDAINPEYQRMRDEMENWSKL